MKHTTRKQVFIIGAQRSGTSYLLKLMQNYTEMVTASPMRPEPKFFIDDELYSKGIEFYENKFYSIRYSTDLFYLEKSTSYIEHEKAAQRIHHHYPHAYIIAVLRHPIDRLMSNYLFSVQNGVETRPIEQAIEEGPPNNYDPNQFSVSPYDYVKRGLYINYLNLWEKYFPRENIILILFEDIISNLSAYQGFLETIGIYSKQCPENFGQQVNSTQKQSTAAQISEPLLRKLNEQYQEASARLDESWGINTLSTWFL